VFFCNSGNSTAIYHLDWSIMGTVIPASYKDLFGFSYLPTCSGHLPQVEYPQGPSPDGWPMHTPPLRILCAGIKTWPTAENPLDLALLQSSPLCRCPYAVGKLVCYADHPAHPEHGWSEVTSYCREHCVCNPPMWDSRYDGPTRGGSTGRADPLPEDREGEQDTASPKCQKKSCFSLPR
jgi:hypothetical protein